MISRYFSGVVGPSASLSSQVRTYVTHVRQDHLQEIYKAQTEIALAHSIIRYESPFYNA
jgi:hypothetical protein